MQRLDRYTAFVAHLRARALFIRLDDCTRTLHELLPYHPRLYSALLICSEYPFDYSLICALYLYMFGLSRSALVSCRPGRLYPCLAPLARIPPRSTSDLVSCVSIPFPHSTRPSQRHPMHLYLWSCSGERERAQGCTVAQVCRRHPPMTIRDVQIIFYS